MKNPSHECQSDEEFFDWLAAERPFSLKYLQKKYSSLSLDDAKDIFGSVCEQQRKLGEKRFKLLERGILVERLNWKALDFLEKRAAVTRGGKAPHQDVDEIADWLECDQANPLEAMIQTSERLLTVDLLKKVLPRSNKRQYIFATVAANVMMSGQSLSHWAEGFTSEQRMEFMTNSSGEIVDDDDVFRREVNRACCQVVDKLKTLFRGMGGHWTN
ncbi:MAG: hypothetical protein ACJAQT_000091 [Akkermansiaceae bacterium]|jgi:hypothetical protein